MTLAIAPARRGRPSAADDLRLELLAERTESRLFAQRVRHAAIILRRAVVLDRMDVVDQVGNELGYHAARRIQQLGSVVL